jgi:hypothetical protein
MGREAPKLDTRTFQNLLDQVATWAKEFAPEWRARQRDDLGMVLATIYAHYLEILLERLNRVPDKNLLAFLDRMGVGRLPPGAASAPLVFTLAPTAGASGFVPRGTQVATVQTETQRAAVFETEEDLNVVAAQLVAGCTIDPERDRYTDHALALGGQQAIRLAPFVGTRQMPHLLLLGDDVLLSFSRAVAAEINLRSNLPPEIARPFWEGLSYQCRMQGTLKALSPHAAAAGDGSQIRFTIPDPVDQETIQGVGLAQGLQSRWLHLSFTAPLPGASVAQNLRLRDLRLKVSASDLAPDVALSNGAPLDVSKEFLPFGEMPKLGDALLISSQEVFSKPEATVTLRVELQPPPPPTLIWEYASGPDEWTPLPRANVSDGTGNFTRSGRLTLVSPTNMARARVAGRTACWLRARIADGNYRDVPHVTRFWPTHFGRTVLTNAVGEGESRAVVEEPDFAPIGSVLLIGGEFVAVVGVEAHEITVMSPFLRDHRAGTPVRRGWFIGPRLTLAAPAAQKATSLHARSKEPAHWIQRGDVFLLLEEEVPLEFVFVTDWEADAEAQEFTIRIAFGLRFLHNPDASLIRVRFAALAEPVNAGATSFTVRAIDSLEIHPGQLFALGRENEEEVVQSFQFFFVTHATELERVEGFRTYQILIDRSLEFDHGAGAMLIHVGSPPFALAEGDRVDFEQPFYPFGRQPGLGDTFYIGSISEFPPVLTFDVQVEMEAPGVPPQLTWDFLGADGWQTFAPTRDETNAFLQDGRIDFPSQAVVAAEVNGQSSYWIRARLTGGNYGLPLQFEPVDPADPAKGFRVKPGSGNLSPPLITKLTLDYEAERAPASVLTRNGFLYGDQTAANETGTQFSPFVRVQDLRPRFYADAEPSLYLGLDGPLPDAAVSLFLAMPPRQFVERLKTNADWETGAATPDEAEPKLAWEYWNGREWTELAVVDETRSLTESGRVRFLGPADLAALTKFSLTPRYWVRIRLVQDGEGYAPLLSGVFLNAVRAIQAMTVRDEVLGSSNGRQGQVVRLSKVPVLSGQRLWVREPERPPAEEEQEIKGEEGEDAVQIVERADSSREVWVRWHEVKSLHPSGPRSRHYTIDYITGEVRFGNGMHGLIPPAGRDNIVCEVYHAGGGIDGNQPAGAISQLKTSIPYIAAVTNPVAADGGSAAETMRAVRERGPQTLKHRGRALTAQDLEWLARQAVGTRVARARCLPNRNRDLKFEPGWATLIVVPHGTGKKPLPSIELIRAVEDALAARSLATLTSETPARINVIGPGYVPVEVRAEVVPVGLTLADAVRHGVQQALDEFLHPLTGGPDGEGWALGRDVYLSELFAAFEALPGVEHVRSLSFRPTVATTPLKFEDPAITMYPRGTLVAVTTEQGTLQARLAEELSAGAAEAMVTLFREGERVRVTPTDGSSFQTVETTIRGISGSTLTVDPFWTYGAFATGCQVASVDGTSASFLAVGLPPGALVGQLTAQGFAPGQSVTLPDGRSLALAATGDAPNRRLELGQRLRVPEFYLVYSGAHTVNIVAT